MLWSKVDFLNGLGGILRSLSSTELEDPAKERYRLSNGERADLRRMNPTKDRLRPTAFWKIVSRYWGDEKAYFSDETEMGLAAVLQGMALTADDCLMARDGEKRTSFGQALASIALANGGNADGGTVAKRLDQLLRAREQRFFDLLRYMLRFMASQHVGFDWRTLADLCLTENEDYRHKLCSQITKDFYGALWSMERENAETIES